MEIWLALVGYEGAYEVSDQGRVRSIGRVVQKSNGVSMPVLGRILKQTMNGESRQVTLSLNRRVKPRRVHQLVAEAFLGPRPEGMEVCHGPSGRLNNRLTNLRYGTRSENALDRARDGTDNRGIKHPANRFTVDQARRVKFGNEDPRDLISEGWIDRFNIRAIRNGLSWAWLTDS